MEDMQFQLDMLRSLNQQLNGREKMYRLLCSTSQNAFLYLDLEHDAVDMLGNWQHFFDVTIKTPADIGHITQFVEKVHREDLNRLLYLEQTGQETDTLECQILGSGRWIEIECNAYYRGDIIVEKILRIRDITKQKKQNDELRYMAYYDMLTGLYNRNYFVKILGEWVSEAKASGETLAVLCIDIDNFRRIGDALGLVVADELIQALGLFLKGFMSSHVIVAHVTDDTYYMAIKNPEGDHTVDGIYQQILARTSEPFGLLNGEEIFLTVSIGVAEYPEASQNAIELINCSEIVMFRAKESGPGSIKYYETPIFQEFMEHIALENKLKEAINMNRFTLYYQPQYDAKSQKMRGVEALIRWQDEESGKLISPGVFIPLAEKNGMIVPIGEWVLEEGIKKYATWRENFNCNMVLSLNISAIQYKRPDFVNNLLEILGKYKVNPCDIELEMTESVLIDDFDQVITKLHTLKEHGIKISLDDFGTGYSSLSYLKDLPIDTLKIDKSFIDTITHDESTRVITESIVSMVKKLGCETVAEGVETEAQYEYLKEIECDNIQGFLLGKPMSAGEIEKLLEKENA